MAHYIVSLKDANGNELVTRYGENLSQAKKEARYLLSAEWAARQETTHEALETYKVEVLNDDGVCVWDRQYGY